MARERMVTRTIEVLEVSALCMDIVKVEPIVKTLELTGMGETTDDKLLKALKKVYETDTLKVVSINSTNKREELYGMTEIDFLKSAVRLDNETRKRLESTEEPASTATVEPTSEPNETPKKNKK